MMVANLLLSIIFGTGLLLILKLFYFWKVNTLHGIIFNYWIAMSWAVIFDYDNIIPGLQHVNGVWPAASMVGLMFITVFFIMGRTTQISGVSVASVAAKMSMAIPIAAGILLYEESLGLQKLIGILLAIPAVVMTSRPDVRQGKTKTSGYQLLFPFLLFIGTGSVDTAIKYMQHHFITSNNEGAVISFMFGAAAVFGTMRLSWDIIIRKIMISYRSILGGTLLGTVNYFSLFFLIRCLSAPGSESSTIFAFVNLGIVILSFITGLVMFSEHPSGIRIAGLILAVVAIVILSS